MPNYDYECSKCSFEFDKIVDNKDTEVVCPKCGALANRLVCAPGIRGNVASPAKMGSIKPFKNKIKGENNEKG